MAEVADEVIDAWRAAVRAEAPPVDPVTAAKVARILRSNDGVNVPTALSTVSL